MSSNRLTIEVTAKDHTVPLASFLKVTVNALQILQELNSALRQGAKSVQWHIAEVSFMSPLRMTILGQVPDDPEGAATIIQTYIDGINAVEDAALTPPHFSEASLGRAKAITSVLNDGVAALTFVSDQYRAKPTQKLSANVDSILRRYQDKATFEGRLKVISIHGEPKFKVYDPLTNQPVTCYFPDRLFEQAIKAFGRRVSIYGTAKYTRDGKPESVRVEELSELRDRKDLPQFGEIGIIDLTGGMDATAYVRSGRNE